MGKGNLWRTMRGASLDLTCLNQEGSKSFMGISNLAALFGRKNSINHDALVPSYFVVFLCSEVHHLTFWLFPSWHLSSLVTCWCLHWTMELLLHSHSTHWGSSQWSYQGRKLGPLWLRVFPHFTPIVRSFTFQFLHKWNFAVKFTSCSIFPFI